MPKNTGFRKRTRIAPTEGPASTNEVVEAPAEDPPAEDVLVRARAALAGVRAAPPA